MVLKPTEEIGPLASVEEGPPLPKDIPPRPEDIPPMLPETAPPLIPKYCSITFFRVP
jgi:hypothetical protein